MRACHGCVGSMQMHVWTALQAERCSTERQTTHSTARRKGPEGHLVGGVLDGLHCDEVSCEDEGFVGELVTGRDVIHSSLLRCYRPKNEERALVHVLKCVPDNDERCKADGVPDTSIRR
jgi:hypothetical protein